VQGPNPRPVTVAGGATAEASFAVSCAATTGTIQVDVTTSGSPADPDGYVVKLDDAETGNPVAVNGSASFADVPAGTHVVGLSGLADNCSAGGGVSKSTTVTAGATATLSFAVTCAGATGSIQVITATAGASLDFDGYTLALDGDAGQPIVVNGSLILSNVSPGDHSVGLTGVQSNCNIAEANPTPVTVTAGAQASANFTVTCEARIGSIAFATLLAPGLFLVNPDGTDPIKLVDGARPIWSPDGLKVLYAAEAQLNVINADGSGQATLATIARGGPTVYEWSPDGSRIAFCTQTNPADDPRSLASELWLIQANGTGQTLLASNALSATWSPDGGRLVFGDVSQKLHVINSDGSGLAPLTHDSLNARDPVWAPNGTEIVFNANLDIYRVNPDGSGLINLTNSAAVDQMPTWSRDGSRIAFITRRAGSGNDVAVVNRDGSGLSILTNTPDEDLEARWSSDGSKIVFTRAGNSREVFAMNSDGSNQTNVSNKPQEWAGQPDWRPTP
jgi:Tol biopolymer transport system component